MAIISKNKRKQLAREMLTRPILAAVENVDGGEAVYNCIVIYGKMPEGLLWSTALVGLKNMHMKRDSSLTSGQAFKLALTEFLDISKQFELIEHKG